MARQQELDNYYKSDRPQGRRSLLLKFLHKRTVFGKIALISR
ncbi:hypothetical protein [Fischerella thermalis]|nr:hypothetical protein [Fischerella thermalis]